LKESAQRTLLERQAPHKKGELKTEQLILSKLIQEKFFASLFFKKATRKVTFLTTLHFSLQTQYIPSKTTAGCFCYILSKFFAPLFFKKVAKIYF